MLMPRRLGAMLAPLVRPACKHLAHAAASTAMDDAPLLPPESHRQPPSSPDHACELACAKRLGAHLLPPRAPCAACRAPPAHQEAGGPNRRPVQRRLAIENGDVQKPLARAEPAAKQGTAAKCEGERVAELAAGHWAASTAACAAASTAASAAA